MKKHLIKKQNRFIRLIRSTTFCASLLISSSLAFALSNDLLLKEAEAQKAPFLSTLESLVNIESGSTDIAGLNEIATFMAQKLQDTGAEVSIIESDNIYRLNDTPDQLGPIVKATLKGNGTSKIMLMAHLDTVYLKGDILDQPFKIDDDRAYGLGIVDDKQGAALILHIVQMLQNLNYQDYGTLTILLNADEEISSPASRALITETAKDQDIVLSFEGGGLNGDLRLATSGIASAYLDVEGKAAHAGVQPEAGVNALTELAHQLLQMQDLSNAETGLKVNWTIARAGDSRNVIPAMASAQADIRALKIDDFPQVEASIKERIAQKRLADSRVTMKFEVRRPPLEIKSQAIALGKKAQKIYLEELQQEIKVISSATGGGTDAAFAGLQSDAAVIEGMGLSGGGAHSNDDEFILLDSIIPRLYMSTRLIMEMSK